jgi:hypothetical protein
MGSASQIARSNAGRLVCCTPAISPDSPWFGSREQRAPGAGVPARARAVGARHDHAYNGVLNVIRQSNAATYDPSGVLRPWPESHDLSPNLCRDHALDQNRFGLIRDFGASDRAASGTRWGWSRSAQSASADQKLATASNVDAADGSVARAARSRAQIARRR